MDPWADFFVINGPSYFVTIGQPAANSSLEIVRELELYVDAGLTPAEAL